MIPMFLRFLQYRVVCFGMVAVAVLLLTSSTVMAQTNFTGVATTNNEFAVARGLDSISTTASGSTLSMINALAAETPFQQQEAFNQLSGEMFGSTQTIGLQINEQFMQRVGSRLISNGKFLTGTIPCETVNRSALDEHSPDQVFTAWTQGYGVGGSLFSDGNASGVRYSQGAGVYGVDWGDEDSGVIGIAGGNSYVAFHDGTEGYGQLNAYQIGAYALKHNDIGYVLGTVNYGYDEFRTFRNATVGGSLQSLSGSFLGNQLGAYAETGLKLHYGWVHFQPMIGLQYNYLDQQGFSESGGPAALNVSSAQASSLRTNVGTRLILDQLQGPRGSVWTPYWHLHWIAELLDNDRTVNASFVGAPAGGNFTAHGTHIGQNYVIFGKGLQAKLNDQWSIYGSIDLMVGDGFRSELVALGAMYSW